MRKTDDAKVELPTLSVRKFCFKRENIFYKETLAILKTISPQCVFIHLKAVAKYAGPDYPDTIHYALFLSNKQ